MKLILMMQNGAFKPKGAPLSKIQHFRFSYTNSHWRQEPTIDLVILMYEKTSWIFLARHFQSPDE